ncbi:uncharacterized protein PHACADRAFT_252236 [Phanerochaete carnosa HHB-10118-sp]|uniref:Uncharacterized protein n=1 Tax=Phanerochaete carnosa (strain HHB-10118-sp) TaxID=650164 RepID=K5W2P4_PHACS|nr:uncharacterized protein PHACADRAFT_252236 [Phanerochaete carnosa HHB-10118-sp]EKM58153.1 hypothetical protein PHACADRAFT_252236 [Phanerochaete carnosa HHB-10118-sp]
MALPMATTDLIGTLAEIMCYGMYFVLFLQLLRVLYARHQARRPIVNLLAIALLIFSLITAHLSLQIHRILQAFTDHMDVANAPTTYYDTLSARASATKASIYTTLTIVCDAIMVYRVFVVYERRWSVTVIPFVLLLANIAVAAWYTWSVSQVNSLQPMKRAVIRINCFFSAVTLILNLMCTVMISWKIWTIHRELPGPAVAGIRVMGVATVIIESAAIYSCVLVALIVTSTLRTTGLWTVLDPVRSRLTVRPLSSRF